MSLAPCRFTPDTCVDDLCRSGGERGLCGNWRIDAFEVEDPEDDDQWPPDDDG